MAEAAPMRILLVLFLLVGVVSGQGLDGALRNKVRAQYGNRYSYYTIVPYKNTAFAAVYDVDSDTRNSTGRATNWAVYEFVHGHWSYIFSFQSTVDADEESERLDRLFAKHRFSSTMRGNLMYGEERRF